MTESESAYEVPVWEPSTDGPAIESVPWETSSADVRRAAVRIWPVTAVVAGAFWLVWAVGASWIVVLLLGIATAVGVVFSLAPVMLTLGKRMDRGLLVEQSWRRATVAVFEPEQVKDGLFGREARLLVDGGTERAMWLRWTASSWADQQVLVRTGRIWLLGPDPDDRVRFCSAGCAIANCTAEVIREDVEPVNPVQAAQRAPAQLPSAGDDVVANAGLAVGRRFLRLGWYLLMAALAPVLAVMAIVLTTSGPRMWEELVGVGVLLALLAVEMISGLYGRLRMRRVERLLKVGPWTVLPVTPEPGLNLVDTPIVLRLSAILSGGHARSVRLTAPRPLAANIAATGQLWLAGEAAAGRAMAAGLPGYAFYAIAHIGR